MSSPDVPQIGWFGLGSMGLPMASNLQKHLVEQNIPSLHYANRTLSRGDPLKVLGGIPCPDINDLVQASDVIFISVTNDEVLTSVINQFISTSSFTGKVLVDMTSVHPNTTTSVATLLRTHHCFLVAAPVFGPPAAAATAQTLIAVAGMPTAVAVVTPLLEGVLCRGVIHAGSDPAQASLLKASSNFIAAGLQFLLSEAHVLAEKAGLPAPVLESLIEQNFGAYAGNTSKRLTSGSYLPAEGEAPNSALELAMKDVCIGLDVARSEGVRLEIGELSMSAMQEAKRWGDERGKRLDSHSVFGVVRGKAGLGYENAGVRERDGVEEK